MGNRKSILLLAGIVFSLAAFFLLTHNPLSGGSSAERGVYFFYSEHCPHCQAVKPAVLELAEKRKITLCEISSMSEECKSVAEKIGLKYVPTMAIMSCEGPVVFVGSEDVMKAVEMLKQS
ncbi:MAG: thioredoxin family protein [Archaeoglobales archaeon]|nr:thioredoxin family protein [Archaeoglobales archaeon]